MPFRPSVACTVALCYVMWIPGPAAAQKMPVEYRVLATSKTSTMQKEMQEAAEAGFRFGDVMGGDTAFGDDDHLVTKRGDFLHHVTGEEHAMSIVA